MKIIWLSLFMINSLFAEIVVVINSQSTVETLNVSYIKKVFMKKIKELPSGEKLIPLDQDYEKNIYNTFYKSIANKNGSKMRSYWAKLTFTGKKEAPVIFNSDTEIINMLMNNPLMIGYIDESSVVDGIKVIYKLQ